MTKDQQKRRAEAGQRVEQMIRAREAQAMAEHGLADAGDYDPGLRFMKEVIGDALQELVSAGRKL